MTILTGLLSRGLHLFPIKSGAKFPPLVTNWPEKATSDMATLMAMWPKDAVANVGVHCAGLLVVDVDPKAGGILSFKKLDEADGFPHTYTVRTPSGGVHLYYLMPVGQEAPNTVGRVAPGIDIRGRNGYVVGEGSSIPAGTYKVERDVAIVVAPLWLVDRVGVVPHVDKKLAAMIPDAPASALDRAREWLLKQPGAVEGQGGDAHTFRIVCGLRDYGISAYQAADLIGEWNVTCIPPWELGDLDIKVANAYRYADGEPGSKAAMADDFPVAVDPLPEPVKRSPVPDGPTRLSVFAKEAGGTTDYIVKGVLYENSYALIYGFPGEGKTFVALDLAFHVAAGREWLSHRVRQGTTLYLAYEGMGGMRKRAQALLHNYGDNDVPLYIDSAGYNLRELAGRQALGCLIAAMPEKPSVIVFDTFARALCGGDENSAQDVGAFNTGVKALIDATGACVIILHHPPKTGGSARGSGALPGAVDVELCIENGRMYATKQRDVELGQPIGFKLATVVIGEDVDGDPVTSCIVLSAPLRAEDKQSKLRGKYLLAWDMLCEKRHDNTPITELEFRQACEEFSPRPNDWSEIRMRLKRDGLIDFTPDGCIVRSIV